MVEALAAAVADPAIPGGQPSGERSRGILDRKPSTLKQLHTTTEPHPGVTAVSPSSNMTVAQ
jgi:hypothetical protein